MYTNKRKDASEEAMGYLVIHAQESFYDVEITCEWSVSVIDDCYRYIYDNKTNIYMACGYDVITAYPPSCRMELATNTYSDFQCINESSKCYDFLASVSPTMDPTMEPTMDPTIDPTGDPTTDPTRDPS